MGGRFGQPCCVQCHPHRCVARSTRTAATRPETPSIFRSRSSSNSTQSEGTDAGCGETLLSGAGDSQRRKLLSTAVRTVGRDAKRGTSFRRLLFRSRPAAHSGAARTRDSRIPDHALPSCRTRTTLPRRGLSRRRAHDRRSHIWGVLRRAEWRTSHPEGTAEGDHSEVRAAPRRSRVWLPRQRLLRLRFPPVEDGQLDQVALA